MPVRFAPKPGLCVALTLVLALASTGCVHTYNASSLGMPVTMATAPGTAVVGDTFRVDTKAFHAVWGLFAVRQPNLQQVLAGQLGANTGVANLSIRSRKRWSDILVTGLTLGLLSPTSVRFEGVIVTNP